MLTVHCVYHKHLLGDSRFKENIIVPTGLARLVCGRESEIDYRSTVKCPLFDLTDIELKGSHVFFKIPKTSMVY